MRKITKIELQKNNKNKVNIYINNSYSFSCDLDIVYSNKIENNMKIDEDQLMELIAVSNTRSALQTSINYLSFKSRTKYEVIDYLLKKGYDDRTINEVLDKLIDYRYIDDKQYVENYISTAINEKKKSLNTIKLELIKKGIHIEIIDQSILSLPLDTDLNIAKNLTEKFFNQKSYLPKKQLENKVSQLLYRKGFSWEVIESCLNNLYENYDLDLIMESNIEQHKLQAAKLAEKYLYRYIQKENNSYVLKRKISHALYQKGYDNNIIEFAIEKILPLIP